MIDALDESLFKSRLLEYIKLLVLAGDVFDRLLSLDDPNIKWVDLWIARLLRACSKHGVILRVLEGTPSHDRRQSERFATILEMIDIPLDFKYITEVDIEHIDALNIDVLYVPDEAHGTTTETQEVVKAKLQARGLTQVGISVMHGYFQHQIPYQTKEGSYHELQFYESITKYWITIGHVHTRSRVGKALAQGSHDCTAHGEEGPKGYVVATIGKQEDEAWFIDNDLAHVYKTLEVYDMDVEQALEAIDKMAEQLPQNARFRIQGNPDHPIFESIVKIQIRWPHLVITKHQKSRGEKTVAEKVLEDTVSNWVPIRIDKETIFDLMGTRLTKRGLENADHKRLLQRLKECV